MFFTTVPLCNVWGPLFGPRYSKTFFDGDGSALKVLVKSKREREVSLKPGTSLVLTPCLKSPRAHKIPPGTSISEMSQERPKGHQPHAQTVFGT